MARPGDRVAAWTIDGPQRPVRVYAVRSHRPAEVYFQWHEEGQETVGERISRHVTGAPGRLLTYREDNPTLAAVDTVGWVFDPHHEPDSLAAAVLDFVDGLTVELLLDFARRAAADEFSDAETQLKASSRELERGRKWVAAGRLVEAALMFTDPEQVKVGLALVPDWARTPDELVLAVLAVTRSSR